MPKRPKILLLDDEQDLLELYKEILSQLPSQPEITLCNSGARALALLEAEPHQLMISDLRMPKIDGLQVLSIVRRKFPQLRIIIMTSVIDEQYRSRAYAMGVDLFWEKPGTPEEIKMFQDCVAGFLERDEQSGGFRGVQTKSLVDLVQLECLAKGSSVLRILHGSVEGKIYIQDGEVIDATMKDLVGEPAFKEIFSWRTGNFEIYPPDPSRERTIFSSYHGLLLDSAQAMDEALKDNPEPKKEEIPASPLTAFSKFEGVEFAMSVTHNEKTVDSWGVDSPNALATMINESTKNLRSLGDLLRAGDLTLLTARGLQYHIGMASGKEAGLCIGFKRALDNEQVTETMNQILAKWVS